MSINIKKMMKLNDLVSLYLRRKHTLVLNPKGMKNREDLDEDIVYDKVEWEIPKGYDKFIQKLKNNDTINLEDKILKIYEKIGIDYVYDDNLISYIKKVGEDTFSVPDWYGRDTDKEWKRNRSEHRRRICYELARYLAKCLLELLKDNSDYEICIHWDKDYTHYFVGLTCSDYSITLDPDDFFNIKDVTRLKTGLTAQGIKILDDKEDKIGNALRRFNKGRSQYAIRKMEHEVEGEEIVENPNAKKEYENELDKNDEIIFLKKTIKILSEKYNLDSQGIFEYLKEIIDIKMGADKREKIWKEIPGETKEADRYIRCLLINLGDTKVLIDVDAKKIRAFSEEEFEEESTPYKRYNELPQENRYYNGR